MVVGGDTGTPIVAENPESPAAKAFVDVAGQVAAQLSKLVEGGAENSRQVPIMPGPLDWK